ncbi:hypothetical protein OOT33_04315 [Sphingobium sp. DEHP117]|uniref:hypothetical protein n=1 Tax=Sphingobium sp. DEHP117 TaxID=2993436 RepID=UPI0027D59812|nr:hypothetical protein [Sphingobium sp. DEHP117]MDQ4419664.1 hypothetical protein [Sphingobium sp. DEHP117]
MMTATALIFPLALVAALSTIAVMLRNYAGKMMAALRMELDEVIPEAPLPPARIAPRSILVAPARTAVAPAPLPLVA